MRISAVKWLINMQIRTYSQCSCSSRGQYFVVNHGYNKIIESDSPYFCNQIGTQTAEVLKRNWQQLRAQWRNLPGFPVFIYPEPFRTRFFTSCSKKTKFWQRLKIQRNPRHTVESPFISKKCSQLYMSRDSLLFLRKRSFASRAKPIMIIMRLTGRSLAPLTNGKKEEHGLRM